MASLDKLSFTLEDYLNGRQISLEHLNLDILSKFAADVTEFVKGSDSAVQSKNFSLAVESGSLKLTLFGLATATNLAQDLLQMTNGTAIDLIDPKRAQVAEKWSMATKTNPNKSYSIKDPDGEFNVLVDQDHQYALGVNMLVPVEKYLYGKIVDLGGKTTPNIHLQVDQKNTLQIHATQDFLANDTKNRLYKSLWVRVAAKQDIHSGELSHIRLIEYIEESQPLESNVIQKIVDDGTLAWSSVPDINQWLATIRGN
jgi:hypothetical protein